MRARILFTTLLATAALAALGTGFLFAQAPAPSDATKQEAAKPALPVATVNQLMRGLFFPHSNVVFAPQRQDPAQIKSAAEPSASTDPLTGVFGQWEAVENSALVLIETADLLLQPRMCSNGVAAPVNNGDWKAMTAAVKKAGQVAYEAAKTKSQDKMIDAAEVLNDSCAACHGRYRRAQRCK